MPVLLCLLLVPGLACQKGVEDRLEEVRALQDLGAWEDSVAELRAILEESPDHPEGNYLLGVAQLRQGHPSLAVWPLQMAQRDPALAAEAHLELAVAYAGLRQFPLAIEAAGRVVEADSVDPEDRAQAHRLRAGVFWEEGQLDEALAEAERLVELRPRDATALALRANVLVDAGQHGEAEEVLRSMWQAEPGEFPSEAVVQAGLGLVRLFGNELEDQETATDQIEEVLERYPDDLGAVQFAAAFFDGREDSERADAVVRAALELAPTDLELRTFAASRLAAQGQVDEGEALLEEGTELLESPSAWLALERYRRQIGDVAGALEAIERTLALLPEATDPLRFEHGDLLITHGDLGRAREVAEALGDSVYADILRGRLAFEQRRYAEALEHLDAGLRRWPNNPGARHLAGKAAFVTGDLDRALSDLREAVRATVGNSDAGLDLARIHMGRGEPDKALPFAMRTFNGSRGPNGDPARAREALRVAVEALAEQGRIQEARQRATVLASLPGGAPAAVEAMASLVERTRGPDAAADFVLQTSLDLADPANAAVLRVLGQYLVEADRVDEALEQVEAALEKHPEAAELHDARGRVLVHARRPEDARKAFERALELEAGHAPALEGLARLAQAAGDPARSRELFDRAAEVAPESADYAYAAAQIALAQGDEAAAEARLREALRRDAAHAAASNDLAWILAERGEQLEEALALARRAAAGSPTANVLDTLGWVQLQRGEAEAALATLERAHALAPESPSIAYRLGLALAEVGRTDRARALLERALASGAFPESEAAREQLVRLGDSDS